MSTDTAVTARDQLFFDLFTTALEGGIGYWSECSAYHWELDGVEGTYDVQGFRADVYDAEEDDAEKLVIDRSVIARGYRLATSREWRNKLAWSSDKPPIVITADTDWDYDAGDADLVVQLGLFGEVVYG